MTDSKLLFCFDPWSDWVAPKRQELAQLDPRAGSSPDLEIARLWLGMQHRLIESKPRRVIRPERFAFDRDDELPLLEIERRAEQGRDLNSFLGKGTRDPYQRDALLSDWGIHHLHLNIVFESDEFRRRSGRLLFVRAQPEELYFIAVGDHDSWSDVKLIEIVHNNWPESIAEHRIPGLPAPRDTWSAKERQGLRKAGGQTLVSTNDGTTYAPIGGGYATDGTSLDVSFRLSQIREYLLGLRDAVRESEAEIRQLCWANGVNPDDLHLHLVIENETPYAVDDRLNVKHRLRTLATQQGVEPRVD